MDSIKYGNNDGVDNWSLKEFMWEQGIPFWTDIHHRIRGLFTAAGALVYYVECMDIHHVWTVGVGRSGVFGDNGPELRKYIHRFLHQGGIKLDRHEPLMDASSSRMKIHFVYEAGELGKRVTFAKTSRGKIVECREELDIRECALESHQGWSDEAEGELPNI